MIAEQDVSNFIADKKRSEKTRAIFFANKN